VLLSPRCCDPLYRKSLRVSMGHALRVPFAVLDPWAEGLRALSGMGYEVFALDPAAGAEPIDGLARPARAALVLGAEGPGLTPQARSAVGRRVVIPMAVGVDSLNIAVAAAVALQRLVRPMPDAAECPVPLPE
jgi:tRNA G18 (ribose-2'-O)-methylase SpoU